MSFSIKKRTDDIFYISQNSATNDPDSDHWSGNENNIYNNNLGGNVGINVSNPQYNLDVSGTTNISGNLTVDNNTLVVNSTTNNIGINVSNPTYTLDVSGTTNINGTLIVNDISNASLYPVALYTVGGPDINANQEPVNISFTSTSILRGWTYNPSTYFLTCPANGLYFLTCLVNYNPPNAALVNKGNLIISINTNGSGLVVPSSFGAVQEVGSERTNNINFSWILNLLQGSQIAITSQYDDDDGTGDYINLESYYLTIHKIG